MSQIQAIQSDNALKYDTAKVEIELVDINDNLPQFEVDVYNISIVENLPNGFSVLQVVASDQDQVSNGRRCGWAGVGGVGKMTTISWERTFAGRERGVRVPSGGPEPGVQRRPENRLAVGA